MTGRMRKEDKKRKEEGIIRGVLWKERSETKEVVMNGMRKEEENEAKGGQRGKMKRKRRRKRRRRKSS